MGVSSILNWRRAVATFCVALSLSAVGIQAHALTSRAGHDFSASHVHEAADHDDHHDEAPALPDMAGGETLTEASDADPSPAGPAPASHHHHGDTVSGLAAASFAVGLPTSVSPARLTLAGNDHPPGWLPSGPDEPPRPLTHSA